MPNDIISLTSFKNDASGWVKRLQKQPAMVLTQNGQGVAVVQSYEAYRQTQDGLALMKRALVADENLRAGKAAPQAVVLSRARARLQAKLKARD